MIELAFSILAADFAHLAEDDTTGEPVGFALWFLNFSTWRGVHGIYLEDLYVRPEARGGGHGKALLRELARTALGFPVEPLPLMAGVPLGPLVALDSTAALGEWAVAYGLALRGAPAIESADELAEVARA